MVNTTLSAEVVDVFISGSQAEIQALGMDNTPITVRAKVNTFGKVAGDSGFYEELQRDDIILVSTYLKSNGDTIYYLKKKVENHKRILPSNRILDSIQCFRSCLLMVEKEPSFSAVNVPGLLIISGFVFLGSIMLWMKEKNYGK